MVTSQQRAPSADSQGPNPAAPSKVVSQLHKIRGSAADVINRIPFFDRGPFSVNGTDANEFYDMIVRQPLEADEKPVPVGVVSKRYALIQHRDVVEIAAEAVRRLGVDGSQMEVEVRLSTYGERMFAALRLPSQFDIEPGDGRPLSLSLAIINSVDGSTPFSGRLEWLRLVCSNGMVTGRKSFMRRVHTKNLDPDQLGRLLDQGLKPVMLSLSASEPARDGRVRTGQLCT